MAEKRTLPLEGREEAEKIASGPYAVIVSRDIASKSDSLFFAVNPELEGCMARGKTSEEAIENLKEARTDYIQVFLLSNTPVPIPAAMQDSTCLSGDVNAFLNYDSEKEKQKGQIFKRITVQDEGEVITQYSFKTLTPCEP